MSNPISRRSLIVGVAGTTAAAGLAPHMARADEAKLDDWRMPALQELHPVLTQRETITLRLHFISGMVSLNADDIRAFSGSNPIRDTAKFFGLPDYRSTDATVDVDNDDGNIPALTDVFRLSVADYSFAKQSVGLSSINGAAPANLAAGLKDGWEISINKVSRKDSSITISGLSIESFNSDRIRRYLDGYENASTDQIDATRIGGDFVMPQHGRLALLHPIWPRNNNDVRTVRTNVYVIEHI